jgi:hypothetical protein
MINEHLLLFLAYNLLITDIKQCEEKRFTSDACLGLSLALDKQALILRKRPCLLPDGGCMHWGSLGVLG